MLALEAADRPSVPDVQAALINSRLHLREIAVLDASMAGASFIGGLSDVNVAAFSPDGRFLVSGGVDTLRLMAELMV